MKKIGVLGSGSVGQILSDGLLKHGYDVMRGSRDPQKLAEWQAGAGVGARAKTGTFTEAAHFGELVILAVKGSAAGEVVAQCAESMAGKAVLDTTNPIAEAPPEKGVLRYFTGPNESLMEKLQARVPAAHFVKAFSSVGGPLMVNPDFGDQTPTMFICGDNAAAKHHAETLLKQFGWEIEDLGAAIAARAIEPLCMLWCIPGLARNEWSHAFKLLKK